MIIYSVCYVDTGAQRTNIERRVKSGSQDDFEEEMDEGNHYEVF